MPKTIAMKNKKTNLLLVLMLTVCGFMFSGAGLSAYHNKKSILWKISGNGLEHPSYLFGTVHIMDSSQYFLHSTVKEKIASCDKMVFEINTNEPDYQTRALKYSFLSNDSLENIFSKEEYLELEMFFKNEFNFSLTAVHKMKPFYLSAVINALSMPKNAMSYEAELRRIAIDCGMGITGISTLEKENEILEQMDMETQKYTLYEAIKEYKNGFKQREQIMQHYRKNNIQAIYELMMKNFTPEEEIVYNLMFPKRHEVWVPNMIDLMQKQSCFFAVGVGHLPGEQGLLRILENQGFKVRPVNMDFKLFNGYN